MPGRHLPHPWHRATNKTGGKLDRPEKQDIEKKITGRLNEVRLQQGKKKSERERAKGREMKRKGKGQLHREDTGLTWRKKTSHGRLERHDARDNVSH